jgi:hypothetical protein
MSTDPDRPEPDWTADELYLFADGEPDPAARPKAPVPDDPAPKKRRRRKREADEETASEETEPEAEPGPKRPDEVGERILTREEEDRGRWWAVPVGMIAVGLVLCLVPIGVMAAEIGAGKAALYLVLMLVAVVVQVAGVTAFLMAVGTFFGIDYGPAKEAVLKLAAVVAVVDGLTAVMLLCNPCGLVLAAIIGVGVFQYLFRLAVFETLISVAGMVAAAWILNAAVVSILVSKRMPKTGESHPPPTFQLRRPDANATVGVLIPPRSPTGS